MITILDFRVAECFYLNAIVRSQVLTPKGFYYFVCFYLLFIYLFAFYLLYTYLLFFYFLYFKKNIHENPIKNSKISKVIRNIEHFFDMFLFYFMVESYKKLANITNVIVT